MYASLYELLRDLTGFELPFLKIFNMFGLFVALAFAAAFRIMVVEIRRKTAEGHFTANEEPAAPSAVNLWTETGVSALIWYLLGFKLPLFVLGDNGNAGPQELLLSGKGYWIAGIIAGGAMGIQRYRQMKKQIADAGSKTTLVQPWQHMGNIALVAALGGFAGAKIFHLLENWGDFIQDPLGNLFSKGGWTFFGGLICGAGAVLWYCRKLGMNLWQILDSGGPAMMAAYAVGRMGCQLSGDGDWGINNVHPKPGWLSWIPDWAWAYRYPGNVIDMETPIPLCEGDHCFQLAVPVYPTPFYEILMAGALFVVLWALRKRIQTPGALFGLYMIFAGIERFLIEKIRVNSRYEIGSFSFTQAELIAVLMVLGGAALWYYRRKQHRNNLAQGLNV